MQQLEDGLGELRSGGPGFVHAGAGEHVGASRAFADARVAIAGQERLAAPAGFLKRLGAPRTQLGALEVAPQVGVQHEVLQVAVRGAHGTAEPRRHEDAHGGHAVRMHVEEAEDLRLGIAEGVEDRAGFEWESDGRSTTIFMPTAHSRW